MRFYRVRLNVPPEPGAPARRAQNVAHERCTVRLTRHALMRPPKRKSINTVATDYDEVRPDVAESRNASLEALKSANSPDARSVVLELDEADTVDGVELPGADLSGEELIIQVIPQAADEFTCYSCFLVRHRSQLAREKDGHAYCIECEG
ncbi:protein of unknown function [Arthrobacter sp. ov118]|nr:protein of unknown function [Arthrobacter sp. ov118]